MRGHKGFVFTLDLLLGISVSLMLLLGTLFFIEKGSESSASTHYLLRLGSDIVKIMEKEGKLETLDYGIIEQAIAEILPANDDMLLRLQGNFSTGNGTIEVGGEIPQKRFVASGQRVALTKVEGTYLKITYFVWERE